MEITGSVMTGIGEGALYVRRYSEWLEEKLGFRPFPGTLNLIVSRQPASFPLLVVPKGEGLFTVKCAPASINGEVEGAVVRPGKTRHGDDVLEVLAPVNLRERFNLKDGDEVTVSL